METAVIPPEAELQLLTDWAEPGRNARIGRSAVLSLVTHVFAIVFLLWMPETFMQPARPKDRESLVTPLVMPPLTLTQKAPNTKKIIREFRSEDLTPRVKAPSGPSPDPEAAAPHKPKAAPPPPPPASLPEPPKVEIAVNENPKLTLPVEIPQPPQPKTKPSFEDITPQGAVPPGPRTTDIPGQSAPGAIRGALAGRGPNGQQGTAPIASSGAELPQLLSDPMGVDFTAYLAQVLATVKKHWLTMLPRSGRRGYVSIQFAIEGDGALGKVAFAQQTNDPRLDGSAIQAISMGAPFGPLPPQYRGKEIHVQMNFAYFQPKQ